MKNYEKGRKTERQEEKMHRTGFTPYFPLSKPDQILSKTNKCILFFPTGFFWKYSFATISHGDRGKWCKWYDEQGLMNLTQIRRLGSLGFFSFEI